MFSFFSILNFLCFNNRFISYYLKSYINDCFGNRNNGFDNNMKVIFLDIDGVLNSQETIYRCRGVIGIDPYLVSIFNRIIFATDAEIVLSSSWRYHEDLCKEITQKVMPFMDKTPRMPIRGGSEAKERGKEVNAWLKEHPEVTKYAILDDDSDFFDDQPLFKTTWAKGITEEVAKAVIRHLNS